MVSLEAHAMRGAYALHCLDGQELETGQPKDIGSMPFPVIIREASSSSRQKWVQRSTVRHYAEGEPKLKVSTGSLTSEEERKQSERGWRTPGDHGLLAQLSRAHMGSQN